MISMRMLSVIISDEAMKCAKLAAVNADIPLRSWVERAVEKQAATESHDRRHAAAQKREGK